MSCQKKDGRGHARPSFFWYDNDKDLKVCFLVTRVKRVNYLLRCMKKLWALVNEGKRETNVRENTRKLGTVLHWKKGYCFGNFLRFLYIFERLPPSFRKPALFVCTGGWCNQNGKDLKVQPNTKHCVLTLFSEHLQECRFTQQNHCVQNGGEWRSGKHLVLRNINVGFWTQRIRILNT